MLETTELGNSGIIVSRVGFGVHPMGPSRLNLPVEAGADIMLYAYERGIRFFDTAQFYHTYNYVRAGLDKIRGSEVYDGEPVICSKSLKPDYDGMFAAIEEACRETGRAFLDIFLLHQAEPGWQTDRAGARQALIDAKRKGLIRAIGLSTHHQDVAAEAGGDPEMDVVFALLNRTGLGIRHGAEAGSAEEMLSALKQCRRAGKGVFTMKVFGGGNLIGDYQISAGFIFHDCRETVQSAVVGFTSKQEIDDLLNFLDGSLNAAYNPPLDGKRLRVDREDCLGCGSCVKICASGAMHFSKDDGLAEIDETRCVSCGYCAIACPQRAIVFW